MYAYMHIHIRFLLIYLQWFSSGVAQMNNITVIISIGVRKKMMVDRATERARERERKRKEKEQLTQIFRDIREEIVEIIILTNASGTHTTEYGKCSVGVTRADI